MNRILGCVLACGLLWLSTAARAQDAAVAAPKDEATHQALRALKTDMEQALNARDLDRLLSHLHPSIVFTTMNNDVVVGKPAVRDYYEKMLNGPTPVVRSLTARFEADDLTRLYGNTGLAQGSSQDHYVLTDGSDFIVHGRWSCALVKEGDQWLIASFHYSTNVFDNPVLDKVKHATATAAGGASIVCLLGGLIVGRLMGRQKASS
jgi:uncharacterized protein (TIGR02246 family)